MDEKLWQPLYIDLEHCGLEGMTWYLLVLYLKMTKKLFYCFIVFEQKLLIGFSTFLFQGFEINDQIILSAKKSFVSAIQRDSGPSVENDITNDKKFITSTGEKEYETIPTADKHKPFTCSYCAKKFKP